MTLYNESNITSVIDFLTYANYVTDYWFGTFIVIVIFLLTFGTTNALFGGEKSLAISSFFTFIISAMLFLIRDASGNALVGEPVLLFFFALSVIGLIILLKGD